MFKEV